MALMLVLGHAAACCFGGCAVALASYVPLQVLPGSLPLPPIRLTLPHLTPSLQRSTNRHSAGGGAGCQQQGVSPGGWPVCLRAR